MSKVTSLLNLALEMDQSPNGYIKSSYTPIPMSILTLTEVLTWNSSSDFRPASSSPPYLSPGRTSLAVLGTSNCKFAIPSAPGKTVNSGPLKGTVTSVSEI